MVQKILAAVCSVAMFAVAPGSAEASNGAVIAPSTKHRDSRIGPILGASVVKRDVDYKVTVDGPGWVKLRVRVPKSLGKAPVLMTVVDQDGSRIELRDPMSPIRPRARGYPLGRDYGIKLDAGKHVLTVRNASSKSVMLMQRLEAKPKDMALLSFPEPASVAAVEAPEPEKAAEPPKELPTISPEALAETASMIIDELAAMERSAGKSLEFALAEKPDGATLTAQLLDESILSACAKRKLAMADARTLDARIREQLTAGSVEAGVPGVGHMVQVTLLESPGGSSKVTVGVVAVQTGMVKAQFRLDVAEPRADTSAQESRGLRASLRRMGDQVASALDGLEGEARYQQFAVLNFEEIGERSKTQQLGLLVSAELTTSLVREHGLLLVERQQMESILNEVALGQTGLISPQDAVEVGKLAGAQAMVIGSVAEAGDRFLVNSRVVATGTGEVLVAEQATLPAADLVALSSEAVVLRTRSGAVFRSVLIPGWGQFYNREPMKGSVYLVAELGLAGLALNAHFQGNSLASDYRQMTSATKDEFESTRLDAENNYAWRDRFILMGLGVHVVNVLDAFIFGKSFDKATLSAVPTGDGGMMAWSMGF